MCCSRSWVSATSPRSHGHGKRRVASALDTPPGYPGRVREPMPRNYTLQFRSSMVRAQARSVQEVSAMLDIPFRSAKQLAADIRKKKIGCLELLDLYLARIEKYDGALNAVVVRDFARARSRARAADRALSRGQVWGPLHGVPMTIKESYDVAGLPTTWGVPAFKNNIATTNALAVDRLLGAGVVLFGKTNVPLYLADWQSFNAIYGTTNNPWDVSRAPGGSSGGAATALAAGLTALEAGSDIGSALPNPAPLCGGYAAH